MADMNKTRDDITNILKKIKRDMSTLCGLYDNLSNEIEKSFREELGEQKGSIEGLEDFYQLTISIKRNAMIVKNSAGLLNKMKNISNYNITEETEHEELARKLVK